MRWASTARPAARGRAGPDPLQRRRARDRRATARRSASSAPRTERDRGLHVWVDETRPLLQGARLTAWELAQEGIAATLISDSTAAWLMAERQGRRGRDRRRPDRPNGDTANKIGTYGVAVLARAPRHAVLRRRADVDHRPGDRERARRSRSSSAAATRCAARPRRRRGVGVYNPAFDVTPAGLTRDRHRARRAPAAVPVQLSAPDVSELAGAPGAPRPGAAAALLGRAGRRRSGRASPRTSAQIDLDLVGRAGGEPARAGRVRSTRDGRSARGRAAGARGRRSPGAERWRPGRWRS